MNKILIIDDDEVFLHLTSRFLKKHNLDISTCENWNRAETFLNETQVDLVIIDLHLPDASGIDVIPKIKKINPSIPILMITAHSSLESAIEAVKAGAEDYIQKPCENSEILFRVQRTFENTAKIKELKKLKELFEGQYNFQNIVTSDENTKKTLNLAATAKDLDITIYISGETGVGKEVLAKSIHISSIRAEKPFVVFNCAAINENLVESELFGHKKGSFTSAHADKKGLCETVKDGTLFIDEVGELSLSVQKKILRLLQEKEYEAIGSTKVQKFEGRVIAASHRDLKDMIKNGTFREDLFFRLNVYPLHLNPLRERLNDLMYLANSFLDYYSKKYNKNITSFTPRTIRHMMEYSWPGNIRELVHFIERQVLTCNKIEIDIKDQSAFTGSDLKNNVQDEEEHVGKYNDFIKKQEKKYFKNLLRLSKGSIEQASSIADIHRKTLYIKLKEHDLDKKGFR